jgi:hypothetical protein
MGFSKGWANRPLKLRELKFVLPKITRLDPAPYYLPVVAIVKNGAPHLEEWIDLHYLVECSRL